MLESHLRRKSLHLRASQSGHARIYHLPHLFAVLSEPLPSLAGHDEDPSSFLDQAFLEGGSPIDLRRLALTDPQQAGDFLRSYGYNLENPSERNEVMKIHREAIEFIRQHLCAAARPCDVSVSICPEVEFVKDIRDLLVWASRGSALPTLQPWACAVLRVMHTISLANQVAVHPHAAAASAQILSRFRAHLHENEAGQTFLGEGKEAIRLLEVRLREEKGRDSLILKLLHKPDNLPQSIYDHVGVRLVTSTKADALRALQYIRRHNLANFAHLTPGRSRNTLVHVESESKTAPNPHSSADFRSIQFTCQELVKVVNPMHVVGETLRAQLAASPSRELETAIASLPPCEPELRFFHPYEVQIFDQESNYRTQVGESSHANYRLRQIRAVRARVFGPLLRPSGSSSRPSLPYEDLRREGIV